MHSITSIRIISNLFCCHYTCSARSCRPSEDASDLLLLEEAPHAKPKFLANVFLAFFVSPILDVVATAWVSGGSVEKLRKEAEMFGFHTQV